MEITAGILSEKEIAAAVLGPLAISLASEDAEQSVAIRVPDAILEGMFGADYESRITWVQVPATATSAHAVAASTPVATAVLDDALILTPVAEAAPTVLTAVATAASTKGTGSYAATPLRSSSSWAVAEQTGAFAWTYDMPAPAADAGPVPKLGLSYNSQSVDGLTASTNNQPSAVGEGWDLSAGGFIERAYVSCAADDGTSGPVTTSGDLCWRTDNATISMAGHSGPLIRDSASGKWRLQDDDGTRFEHLEGTGAGCAANGTAKTDCWRMTTTDGIQYYFGLNRLPGWATGKFETNSTWTVPVYGNDPGEPCHASTFAASSCMQAWRWNLDYVVDVHGNAQVLKYAAETNKYAKGGSGATSYRRGGALTQIEYGLRSDNIFGANAAGYRVQFTYDSRGRCNDATGEKCTTGSLTSVTKPTNPAAYPDVPWDQLCTGTACSASQISPTFFTNANLSRVQTQVLVSGAYSTVDSWALSHSFPDPGDGTSAALWLSKVQRTGTAAGQAAITEPATVFSGVKLQNRVWVVDGLAPLVKWRLSSIKTALGAVVSVNYQPPQCTPELAPSILASPETNTRWCFPEYWVPKVTPPQAGKTDLFNKYPVASIQVDAKTGGAMSKVQQTQYRYGTPRWRYNDSPLIVGNKRSWNVFAGVNAVEVREGNPQLPAAQKVTKYTYYQGMNGDRLNAAGGTKSVNVTGTTIKDERWFAGYVYRQQTIAGVGGAVVSDTISTPWASAVTANDGQRQARMTNTSKTLTTEPVAAGGSRSTETVSTFDATYGLPVTVSTASTGTTATCVSTTYATANTSAWVIGLPSEVRKIAKSCSNVAAATFPADLVSDVRTAYDGAGWGAAPTRGLVTKTQMVDRYDNGQPHWVTTGSSTFDALGRPLAVTDGLGRTTKTAYTPAAAQPKIGDAVTNTAPFSWVTKTTYEPTTGAPVKVIDPNGSVTTVQVDGLGRTSKVWLPLQSQAANPTVPSLAFTYALSQTTPNAIRTDTLTGGGIVQKYELFDGLGRTVQTQAAATGGGGVVTSAGYDDQGRHYVSDNAYWAPSLTPGVSLFTAISPNNIPSQNVTTFDAVGRPTTVVVNSMGTAVQTTTNTYLGADRVDTVPPKGGTVTSTITNALGQKTKLTQYLTSTVTGTGQSTLYQYDPAGRMTKMTDPAGNIWTWTFDLLGNRVAQKDPDSGKSTATYDAVGNMTSTTDARGKTVTTTYDALNRKTAQFAGTASGALLAKWTYDSVKKGLVTASTAYTDSIAGTPGKAYTTTVAAYDVAGNPTETTVSIPSGAPAFGGTTYRTQYYYNADSSLQAKSMPAVGGLPAELVRYTYDAWGRMSGIRGTTMVLGNSVYTPIGQLAQLNRFDGVNNGYTTYSYSVGTGQVMGIKDNAVFSEAGHYVADRKYTRDAAGNVTSQNLSSALPTSGRQLTCYSYDGLQQLKRAWTPNAASTCGTAPSASTIGGLAPMWNDYTYDNATGNRKTLTHHSAAGVASTATYTYPAAAAARPHAVEKVAGPTDLGAGTYVYDAAGNMTAAPGQAISFNDLGKVSKIVAGKTTQTNIYDASGALLLRVSSSEGAALFVGDTTLTKAAGSSAVAGFRTFVGPEGKPVAQRSAKTGTVGSKLTWLFSNLDGTVDVQTVSTTGATTRNLRDPFGAAIGGVSGVWADSTGFLAKPTTASTKLTTMGARTYNAVLGKFISVDPIVDAAKPQQNSGYAYAHNNPLTLSDPSGLRPDECGAGGVQCASGKVGGQWVPVNIPQGKYQGGGSSERSYGDKIADSWNRSWGGLADAWNKSWSGAADAWNKSWAGVPQAWERSWGRAGATWAKSWDRLPDRVVQSLKGAPGAFTNSMKGVPGAFMQSWIKFTETPQAAMWKEYSAGASFTVCGGLCLMAGATTNGPTLGFGLGMSIGASVNVSVSSNNTSGTRYEMGCEYATPMGGASVSVTFDKNKQADGSVSGGVSVGPSFGGKVGCTGMFIFGG